MLPSTPRLSKKSVVFWFSRYNFEYVFTFLPCILHTLPISLVVLGVSSDPSTALCSQTLPLLHCEMFLYVCVRVCDWP